MLKITKNIVFSYSTRPKIIAEISGNHNGSFKKMTQSIMAAKRNGADLVKIQTYEPEDITFKKVKKYFNLKSGLWKNIDLWKLYKKASTPFNWHSKLFKFAKKNNIILFSTPFSTRAVDLLEKEKVALYKIASFEITDLKLIDYVAQTKKPIILSTGVASIKDIKNAIKIIKKYHNKIAILHCVSGYPTSIEKANIKRINYLRRKFPKNYIGLSDHTSGISSSLAASALNSVLIEKHFKLKGEKSVDSKFSIDEKDLMLLRKFSEEIYLSNKLIKDKINKDSLNLRRSIFAKKNIKKGEKINKENIVCLRPKIGICASSYFKILNKKVNKNINKYKPIKKSDLI